MGEKQPNILLIVADQLRADALGCYGNPFCKTPHLDAMAAGGMTFDRAFTVVPVCSPARVSMLTGQYPHCHGVMLNTHIATRTTLGLPLEENTFGPALKEEGYRTHYVGKWHVSETHGPEDFGFDTYVPMDHHRGDSEKYSHVRKLDFPGKEQFMYCAYEGPRRI